MKIIASALGLGIATEMVFWGVAMLGGGSCGLSWPVAIVMLIHWPGYVLMGGSHLQDPTALLLLMAFLWSLGWYFVVRRLARWSKNTIKQ